MTEPSPVGPVRRLAGRFASGWMVRRQLRGVWVRGSLPSGPVVWAANHHSWWDPFVAAATLSAWRRRMALLVDQANIERFPVSSWIGGFGSRRVRTGLSALRSGGVVVCFPEGELRPPGPPRPLVDGAGWLAERGGASLLAVATRVILRGEQAPEAYLAFRPVSDEPRGGRDETTARLTYELTAELAELDRLIGRHDPRRELPGFECVLAGKPSIDERMSGRARRSR